MKEHQHGQKHDLKGNIQGVMEVAGVANFADNDAHINYGVTMDGKVNGINSEFADYAKSHLSIKSASLLKGKSGVYGDWNIKKTIGAREGYLYNGKYTSGETLGNTLFGLNLAIIYDFNTVSVKLMFNKEGFFFESMRIAGRLHNSSNTQNNPTNAPYFGEIPYSGRGVANGYFKGIPADFIKRYGNEAVYGNGKVIELNFLKAKN